MTISTTTESQISSTIAANAKKEAGAKADEKAAGDASVRAAQDAAKAAESPAVVVETASQQSGTADTALNVTELGSAKEALGLAEALGAALAGQDNAIANSAPGQISSLLSEFEAAVA